MDLSDSCPQCGKFLGGPSCRLVQDSCGHRKCRMCLLSDEVSCKLCHEQEIKIGRSSVITHQIKDECGEPVKQEIKEISEVEERQETERLKRNYSNLVLPSHVSEENGSFKCNSCNHTFTYKYNVKYHENCGNEKKPYQCDTCNRGFNLLSHLNAHSVVHLQNKVTYPCDICDKTFLEKAKLSKHKKIHLKEKKLTCTECGKAFKNKDNLRSHKLIHKPEKKYGCTQCKAKFSHSSNLKKHLLSHNADKSHMCDQCGKRFKLKWALTVHRKGHLKVRPNECGICKKSFLHANDLQRHELIHLETKLFECGICNTGFRRKDNLIRHSRNSHPDNKPIVIQNKIQENKPQIIDNPNAINVIKPPQTQVIKEEKKVNYFNAPLKLAFKTPAFKNNYNIHRDYIEPKELNPTEPVNIYEKILLPTPTTKTEKTESTLSPLEPSHYETSFDNNKHAVIKNIKFKLPANYTKLKTMNLNVDPVQALAVRDVVSVPDEHGKVYTELQNIPSVIVDSSGNNYENLHWRRRTAQYLSSREHFEL